MHFTLKLTQIGNSVGVILPKEAIARMKLEKGDAVFLTESPDGYQMAPYNPDVAEQIELGRDFMREYRDTFHALAK
jgi:putative addiction module antidote